MSWKKQEDLGTQLVAKVYDLLKVNDAWSIDCGRGFTYWPGDYAVTVSADLPNFHNAYCIFRLHSSIDVARGRGEPSTAELPISHQMSRAALSALTYDAKHDVYKIHGSVYAHTDNEDWLTRVFLATVGLQIYRAPQVAKDLQETLGFTPLPTGHPIHGPRDQADPMVASVLQLFQNYGSTPSKWLHVDEWQDAVGLVKRLTQACESDEKTHLSARFDWLKGEPIELVIRADAPHADLGSGLALELIVPWADEQSVVAHAAFELNDMERDEWNWCHDLGAWCVVEDRLTFRCFVPNIAYRPGALKDLTHDMALRARWINDGAALKAMGVELSA